MSEKIPSEPRTEDAELTNEALEEVAGGVTDGGCIQIDIPTFPNIDGIIIS